MDGMNHKKKNKKTRTNRENERSVTWLIFWFLLGYHATEYVTSLVSNIIEPLVNSMKIIARRYQLGAVEWSLILTT